MRPPLASLVRPDSGPQVLPVSVNGYPTSGPITSVDDTGETELDIEMAVSMAPRAQVVVYESDLAGQFPVPIEATLATMASTAQHPLCNQLSSSYIDWAPSLTTARYFKTIFPAQGQTFFRGSGDYGVQTQACPFVDCTGRDFSEDNYITFVGGTLLARSGGTYSETAWNRSGSGVFNDVAIPFNQFTANLGSNGSGASTTHRNIVDVAAEANRDITFVVTDDAPDANQCAAATPPVVENKIVETIGGTSAATPLWAGFMALANEQSKVNGLGPIGFFNPVLYAIGTSSAYASSLNDIGATGPTTYSETQAMNPLPTDSCGFEVWSGTPTYPATPGFDLPTGWGSPRCGLIEQLASPSPAPNLAVAVGVDHACAVRSDGTVACWGNNDDFQIGNPAASSFQATPLPVIGLPQGPTVNSISAGAAHTCVALSDQSVWCWGNNGDGELGIGSTTSPTQAVPVNGFSGAISVAAGNAHTCTL